MAHTTVGKWVVRVPRGHYEKVGEHGRSWVADAPEDREMKIEIDYAKLAHLLGQKAAKAKGRKSKLLGGVIVATDLTRGGK